MKTCLKDILNLKKSIVVTNPVVNISLHRFQPIRDLEPMLSNYSGFGQPFYFTSFRRAVLIDQMIKRVGSSLGLPYIQNTLALNVLDDNF